MQCPSQPPVLHMRDDPTWHSPHSCDHWGPVDEERERKRERGTEEKREGAGVKITCGHRSFSVHFITMTDHNYVQSVSVMIHSQYVQQARFLVSNIDIRAHTWAYCISV